MKLNKIYHIILVITGLVFTSCERDANNVTLPSIAPKLVVQCFLSPQDSVTKAYVSMSSPVFGSVSTEDWIKDADVKISDGVITKQLTFDFLSGTHYAIHSSEFKIEAGKTYILYVNTVDGKSVNASCTVPYPANIASLKTVWDTLYDYNAEEGNIKHTVKLSIEWNDIAGGQNFYRVGGVAKTYPVNNPQNIMLQGMHNNSSEHDMVSDIGKDGGALVRRDLSTEVYETVGGIGGNFSFKVKGLRIYLLSCDENYYKYHLTASSNQGSDPFTEPVLVHSNIQGGLGCFGASNQYITEIDF